MTRVFLTRDSVAAGDDVNAPHETHVVAQDYAEATELVDAIVAEGFLPKIAGGAATWVVSSHEPFAVAAQQWGGCKAVKLSTPNNVLKVVNGEVRLPFSYLAQMDPEAVRDVLRECTFAAG